MVLTHTAYSFRFGVLEPKDVLNLAELHGCEPLVLAEINGTAGILPTLQAAKIPLQPAVDLRMGGERLAVLFPETPQGFQALNTWLSEARPHRLHELPVLPGVRTIYPFARAPQRVLADHE